MFLLVCTPCQRKCPCLPFIVASMPLRAAENGAVLADAFVDYPLYHPRPGWAEQNPLDWWQATLTAIRTCLAQGARHGAQASDVQGVGLSGQMHGVVLLDAEHRVLRPCIIWADQRSDAQCRWMTEKVGASRLIEYVSNPVLTGFTAPKWTFAINILNS